MGEPSTQLLGSETGTSGSGRIVRGQHSGEPSGYKRRRCGSLRTIVEGWSSEFSNFFNSIASALQHDGTYIVTLDSRLIEGQ